MEKVYVVGNRNDAYGAEEAIDIKGIFNSLEAAENAIATFNGERNAMGFPPIAYEIREFDVNAFN